MKDPCTKRFLWWEREDHCDHELPDSRRKIPDWNHAGIERIVVCDIKCCKCLRVITVEPHHMIY